MVREQSDIGYVFNPPSERGFRVIMESFVPLKVVMARGHPLAQRPALRLSDCLGYPILLGDETLGGRQLLDAAALETSMSLRSAVTGNSIAVMKRIAAATQALCFQINIDPEDSPQLVAVPFSDTRLRGKLAIGVKNGRSLPSATAVFLEELKADLLRRETHPQPEDESL